MSIIELILFYREFLLITCLLSPLGCKHNDYYLFMQVGRYLKQCFCILWVLNKCFQIDLKMAYLVNLLFYISRLSSSLILSAPLSCHITQNILIAYHFETTLYWISFLWSFSRKQNHKSFKCHKIKDSIILPQMETTMEHFLFRKIPDAFRVISTSD